MVKTELQQVCEHRYQCQLWIWKNLYSWYRKVESSVWNHFSVNYVNNESVCKACNRKITGRNSTNAKNHLKSFHRSLYDQCTQLDDANLKSKKTKIHLHESSRSGCGVVGGIASLLNNVKGKSLNKWAPDSSQKIIR